VYCREGRKIYEQEERLFQNSGGHPGKLFAKLWAGHTRARKAPSIARKSVLHYEKSSLKFFNDKINFAFGCKPAAAKPDCAFYKRLILPHGL
jgi:hypothetical protein